MASLQQIQSRRKAVKNVGQITKAMEVVAATKMRKSQDTALRSRPYADKALELLDRMLMHAPLQSDLVKGRAVKKTLVVIMTSDRGLIGSFNTQVLREADKVVTQDNLVITIGRKATIYATKRKLEIVQSYEGFGEYILPEEVAPLTDFIVAGYREEKWDQIVVLSTHFRTTLKQDVIKRDILPLALDRVRETVKDIIPEHGRYADVKVGKIEVQDEEKDTYIFEPSPGEVLDALLPHLVRMEMYDVVLEANASEHSARRVAMKTASDNAVDLSGSLTLEFNKVRQANITREIIEITSAQSA